MWSISNPHLSLAFERRTGGLLTVDCWVDVNKLDDYNTVQDVCKRGFHMPDNNQGLVFETGNIKFDPDCPREYARSLLFGSSLIFNHCYSLQPRTNTCSARWR